jgi:adenine-specific DNA-methyltransferase
LKNAVEEYRAAWRAKMDEVNACIAANAEQEELVDQPEVDRKITRVSGPFTVEAVQPPEMSLGDAIEVNTGQFAGEPDELGETFVIREVQVGEPLRTSRPTSRRWWTCSRWTASAFPTTST